MDIAGRKTPFPTFLSILDIAFEIMGKSIDRFNR